MSIVRPLIALGVVLALLALIPLSRRPKHLTGTVVDATTGAPLAGAHVTIVNRGWGRSAGQLVWDRDFIYPTSTDAAGRFRVDYRVGSSAHLKVTRPGYLDHDGWYDNNATVVVRLDPQPPASHR